jgi:agmatinase
MLNATRTFPYEYSLKEADVCLAGIPFDSTEIGFSTRHGPLFVRETIKNVVGYDPKLRINAMAKLAFHDLGDVEIVPGNWELTSEAIGETVKEIFSENQKVVPVFLGGEHLITLGVLKALPFEKIHVLHFDAHADLKDDWMGEKNSHITWARRALELKGKNITISQHGVRSFGKDEHRCIQGLKPGLKKDPVYITVDMDVFDPAFAPEVGTPEPCGISPPEFFSLLEELCAGRRIIGMDIVECAATSVNSRTATLAANIFKTVSGLLAKK